MRMPPNLAPTRRHGGACYLGEARGAITGCSRCSPISMKTGEALAGLLRPGNAGANTPEDRAQERSDPSWSSAHPHEPPQSLRMKVKSPLDFDPHLCESARGRG